MESPLLLTVGYGKRSISDVIDLLQGHGVRFLVDIRSAPWSRHHPDFAHDALKQHVQDAGIAYLFMGQGLGGRPDDASCYDETGRVDYEACRQRPAFRGDIGRLQEAWRQGRRVALLCAESRPEECHRSKLVGVALAEAGIDVMHVDEDGELVSQEHVMDRVLAGQLSLFDTPPGKAVKSRGRYRPVEE